MDKHNYGDSSCAASGAGAASAADVRAPETTAADPSLAAVSQATRRRLARVLSHLHKGRASTTTAAETAGHGQDDKDDGIHDDAAVSCPHSSGGVGDIEDLGRHATACTPAHRAACAVTASTCSAHQHQSNPNNHVRMSSADVGDANPGWLFDPSRFRASMKPLLEASTLPPEVYSSTLWWQREMERIFVPSWTLLGRTDEMPEPGNYLAVDTEWGGPVAACRGEDRRIYAFANVCCHRGAKVVPGSRGKGSVVGLICPYRECSFVVVIIVVVVVVVRIESRQRC